jgi:hypothetical protein
VKDVERDLVEHCGSKAVVIIEWVLDHEERANTNCEDVDNNHKCKHISSVAVTSKLDRTCYYWLLFI